MTPIPVNDQTKSLARRLVWFEEPEASLASPYRFMAYAFARASHEDMNVLRQYLSDADFAEALDHAPPGIIDARSWTFWNLRHGRYPAPPMPQRKFP